MSDDFRPMFLMLSGVVLFRGIKILYFPAIIIGGLGVLGYRKQITRKASRLITDPPFSFTFAFKY
jgi:hypothetical protein